MIPVAVVADNDCVVAGGESVVVVLVTQRVLETLLIHCPRLNETTLPETLHPGTNEVRNY